MNRTLARFLQITGLTHGTISSLTKVADDLVYLRTGKLWAKFGTEGEGRQVIGDSKFDQRLSYDRGLMRVS